MKGINSIIRFVLTVFVVAAVGLFGFMAAGRLSAGTETAPIFRMTDAHDRVSVAQLPQTAGTKIVGLSDAHDRAQIVYVPSDAHDRTKLAQGYEIARMVEKISDLSDRHTPEELRALFQR